MVAVLVIGLIWLSVTAVMFVLIARAIGHADAQDEEVAQRDRVAHRPHPQPRALDGGGARAPTPGLRTSEMLDVWWSFDDVFPRPPGGGLPPPYPEPGDRAPDDFPWPPRHPDRPPGPTGLPGGGLA